MPEYAESSVEVYQEELTWCLGPVGLLGIGTKALAASLLVTDDLRCSGTCKATASFALRLSLEPLCPGGPDRGPTVHRKDVKVDNMAVVSKS